MIQYKKDKNNKVSFSFNPFSSFYGLFGLATAMIGYHKHGSIIWSIIDFIFWQLAWVKWLIFHEVSLTLIKETFSFLIQ